MKLYHGTNGNWLNNIARKGLMPRGRSTARNNWKEVPHQSNPKIVYLTDSYAPYFSFNAARESCAVIELDIAGLPGLTYDEDAWEQIGRDQDGVPGDMSQRTLWWRARQHKLTAQQAFSTEDGLTGWKLSLRALGTCGHLGPIPPTALTRAVWWPLAGNAWVSLAWDASITVMNQRFCGARYKAQTAKLFGDEPDMEELRPWDVPAVEGFNPARIKGLRRLTWSGGKWADA